MEDRSSLLSGLLLRITNGFELPSGFIRALEASFIFRHFSGGCIGACGDPKCTLVAWSSQEKGC